MELNKLTRKDLLELVSKIDSIIHGNIDDNGKSRNKGLNKKENLENLIGTIPSFLLNTDIFEKNQDIAEFARKLDIFIPSAEKKNREDIIGRIVSAIAKFDNRKISDLTIAVQEMKKSDMKKGKNNFFQDWENAINQMNI